MKIPLFALPHRVTIVPFLGDGAMGPIWESDSAKFKRNVPCLIEPKVRQLKSANGTDVVQQAEATFHPDTRISIGDRIQWDVNGVTYQVELWTPIDAMGPHSIEAVLS